MGTTLTDWIHNKDVRKFTASATFVGMVLLLLLYLTFIQVPAGNKDLIVSIISMMVGGLSVALNSLLGKNDDELNELKVKIAELELANTELQAKYTTLKTAYDDMQERLVANLDLSLKKVK